jgi:FkbM family methyltransferase
MQMSTRTISSLIVDELVSRILGQIYKRAARRTLFSGIAISLSDPIGHRLMATGMFEATQIDGITQLLERPADFGISTKPAGIFIDVGANIGVFTIAFSRFFDRTIAIEANPNTFAILQANILLRELSRVKPLCVAASNASKASTIFVSADGSLGGATMNPHQHKLPKLINIECRPLDDIVDECGSGVHVGMVKIDVEGHELNVLEGARKTLSFHHPFVLFEALNPPEATRCVKLLAECGYTRFFTFKRGRRRNIMTLLVSLTSGLDVYAEEMNIDNIQRSPLICGI